MSPLRRSYIPIICTFIIGVVVSLTLFVIVKNWEQANQRIEFESRSRGYANAVQGNLNKYLGALNFLGDFFNQSQQITRQEFTIFAESALSRYPGIQAFSWNPLVMDNERTVYESLARKEGLKTFKFTERTEKGALVDAAQRQEYVVVYYITPLETNKPALGYDIASETTRLQAIDQAFKTGELTATDRITLVQETGTQFGVLVFFPLYQQGVSLKTSEARLKYRKGLVVEVLRLGDVVEAALKGFPDEGINIYLYDASAKKGNRLLYAHPSRMPGMTEQPMDEDVIEKDIHWTSHFEIAGRQWKILFSPSPFFLESKQSWQSWLILSGSLFLTAILILHLLKRLTHTTEIECKVREQLRTNQELADEIAECKRMEEMLQKSEAFFKAITENSLDSILILDKKGTITYASPSIECFSGYKPEELIGKSCCDFIMPADLPKAISDFGKAALTKKDVVIPNAFRCRHKNGSELVLEGAGNNLLDYPPVVGFVMNVRDITERKQVEEDLRKSEERYRTILEDTDEGYFEIDLAGNFTFVNDAECRDLGYSREQLIGMNNRQYCDEATAKKLYDLFSNIYKTGKPIKRFPGQFISKDGRRHFNEVSASLIRDAKGKPIGFRGISRDITERKQAEEVLRKSEDAARQIAKENEIMAEIGRIIGSSLNINEVYNRFTEEVNKLISFDRIVINNIDIEKGAVINVYMEGKRIADRKVEEIYPLKGSGNAEMVRTKSTLLIQTEDFDEYKDRFPMLLSTFQAGFRSIMNVPLFSKGRIIGGLLLRSFKPHAYTDQDVRLAERIGNQVAGAIANARLFTELKQTDEERKRLFEEAQASFDELQRLSRRLVEAQEVERQNLARELHDRIGQNLTALSINLNIMRNQLSASSGQQIVNQLDDSLTLLVEMTRRVRDLMGELRPPVLDDYGLFAALRWCGEQFSDRTGVAAVLRGKKLTPRLPLEVETGLFRIAQEALNNVVKHAQAKRVTMTLKSVAGRVRLTIVDDGVGFDPKAKLQSKKQMNWGLITMRERAHAIGGNLHVETAPGKGTKVIVEASIAEISYR